MRVTPFTPNRIPRPQPAMETPMSEREIRREFRAIEPNESELRRAMRMLNAAERVMDLEMQNYWRSELKNMEGRN